MNLSPELQKLLEEIPDHSWAGNWVSHLDRIQKQYQKDKDPYKEVHLWRCPECGITANVKGICKCPYNVIDAGIYVRKSD